MVPIKEPKFVYLDFDLPEDDDKNLKHGIEFIIESNGSLAENKI